MLLVDASQSAALQPLSLADTLSTAFAEIDLTNGQLANRFCPRIARETFLTGTEPPPCQEHGGVGDQIFDWWQRFREWWRR